MSTAPATVDDAAPGEIADRLRSAPFVRVVAAATGDSLAASGVLARALRQCATPFQVRVDPVPSPSLSGAADDADLVVGLGVSDGDVAVVGDGRPASLVAADVVRELGEDPAPVLALAGAAAAGRSPGEAASLLESAAERATIDRRPGLAFPTDDLAEGLAHSTLLRIPQSGDPEAARAALAALGVSETPDETAHRRLASWAAIEASAPSTRAARAVERVLRPYATPDATFATIGGFGDVLDAAARERPGTGVALAIRDDGETRASVLDAWRTHARAVHETLSAARTGRYDGVFAVRVDDGEPGRLGSVARLCLDFEAPEPVVLAVADDSAAAASEDDAGLGRAMAAAVRAVDATGRSAGATRRATARFDDGVEVSRLITAFREAL
jgi:hypothetical protein